MRKPHLKGQQEFERFFGGLVERRRYWQSTAILSLLVNLCLVVGLVLLSLQHKVVPYVVELDTLGESRAVGKVAHLHVPDRATVAVVRRFVHNLRTIPTDSRLLNVRFNEARSFATGKALETFVRDVRGKRDALEAMLRRGDARYVEEISNVLRVPGNEEIYRVTWRETARRNMTEVSSAFEGYFQVHIEPPDTEEVLIVNPFGIYITDYTVSELGRSDS